MAYVYKATITLSVQKFVYIAKHKILPIEGMKKKNMVCLQSICFGI